ncbi:Methylthioribose-1-phosphate isomerase [Pseudomonas aeruginosa]
MRERLLAAERVKAIEWRDGTLRLLDQRLLPQEEVWLEHESAAEVAKAIRDMVVRGAPAIGISAAYGIVLGARARLAQGGDWRAALEEDFRLLADSRPTAVNLFWALNRMRDRLERMKRATSRWRCWKPRRSPSMKATARPT